MDENEPIRLPNQVWATDITLPPRRSYLFGGHIRHFSQKGTFMVPGTLDANFCISALQEAIVKHGIPAFLNTDHGSQFTSKDFLQTLKENKNQYEWQRKSR